MNYTAIVTFWFGELTPEDWFAGGEKLDRTIAERFSHVHKAVAANEYAKWRMTPEGALAEVIVLDQFSRNLYRGTPMAFASDAQALALAQVAIARGFDQALSEQQRQFLYMPYMHSESKIIHETALELFAAHGNEAALKYEKLHKEIIDRFGRYPHRNAQLGREHTSEEQAFLEDNEYDFFSS